MRHRWTSLVAATTIVVSGAVAVPVAGDAHAARPAARVSCRNPSGSVTVGVGNSADPTASGHSTLDDYQAGISALNRAGGLAGCRVEMVVFDFETVGADIDEQSRQECATFTRDNDVLAVFATGFETAAATECFARSRTPVFTTGDHDVPACGSERGARYAYAPSGIAPCRFGPFIGIWNREGLLRDDRVVGIVVVDDDSGAGRTVADTVWGPELRELGIRFTTAVVPAAKNPPGFSEATGTLSDGVARFMAEGVNVVLFTPSGGQGIAGFLPTAAARGYFPEYGVTSADGLRGASTIGAAAIKRAVAISWLTDDLPLADQQSLPANSAVEKCAQWSGAAATTVDGASRFCDFVNILEQTLGKAQRANAATLRTGVEALRTTFVSSLTYGGATKFGPNRHDGGHQARVLEFDTQAKTFRFLPGAKTATIP
jgi:ABC-type branched-subunit amino acid transport system substrate-binding protein